MNIAVILTKDMQEGGAFQYSLSTSLLLEKKKSQEYNFIFFTTVKKNIEFLSKHNLHFCYLPWSNLDRLLSQIINSQLIRDILRKLKITLELKLHRILRRHNIDLIYFLNPSDLVWATVSYNHIFTVWDLCFLDFMEFPEVYVDREFERRDLLYQFALRKAIKVITDSEFTKRNIISRYDIDQNRIVCLPLMPSESVFISEQEYMKNFIDIRKKYNISGDYIFYPAQFWPHKNHIYILEGLKILKEKYKLKINAVFSGSDKCNLGFILKRAKELGVDNQLHYIGFVEEKEMPYLYKQALALVMPTYFGPTNMPPLEAFKLGCPVLYSDLPGLSEQVQDAAVLLDLNDPESMCMGVMKILNNSPEIKWYVENGKKKVESLGTTHYWEELKNIFDNFAMKLKCWK